MCVCVCVQLSTQDKHLDTLSPAERATHQTEEQIRSQFNGMVKRLSAGSAFYVWLQSGGVVFGVFSFWMFMVTQTCRIYSDLWIR